MSSPITATSSDGIPTSVSTNVLSSGNVLKLSHGDGPKVLVQPANPPMPVISPEALGIHSVPSHISPVQKEAKMKPGLTTLSFMPTVTTGGVRDQPNIARSCTITASSTLPAAISLPVQVASNVPRYPSNIPSSVTMPFITQVAQTSRSGDEVRIAAPTSHVQLATHPKESKQIGSIPLRANQPVSVVTATNPSKTSAATALIQTSAATALLQTSAATALLQTSAIASQLKSTTPLIPIRSSIQSKSNLQHIQEIHRLSSHPYSQALKVTTTPSTTESRSEPKQTTKLPVKTEQKLETFTESKVGAKGDAGHPKHNWPISTSKTYTTKPNMYGVTRGIVTSTPIPITYISKPISARTNVTNQTKILQQAPVPRHANFPENQPIFLAGHRQPISSVTGAVPGHPSVTLPHNMHPYYFYREGSFPRYQGITSFGPSFTPITNAGVRQQLNVNPQVSLQPSSNAGAAATVAAVARAATVAGGGVRLGPLVASDLRTTGPSYTIPPLATSEGDTPSGGLYAGNASSTANQPLANAGSSPRPSILRKRHNDGTAASVRKPLFQNPPGTDPASPSSKVEVQRLTASPKQSESLSSSQQSTESNVSAESGTAQSMLIKIKQEKKENDAPITMLSNLQDSLHLPERNDEPSPRKRQRKQQHKIASQQMLDDKSTDEETETKKDSTPIKKEKLEKKQKKMKLVQYIKRSSLKLLDSYHQTWKPAHNHFQRYTDVKAKDEKKAGIHEIANQRGIIKKTDGWKIKHVGHQLTDMIGQEQEVYDEMQAIKDGIEGSMFDKSLIKTETNRIYELIQGNIQRSKYVLEHIEETKSIMGRLLDHKPKVVSIIKKHANKRHAKKKHAT